MELLEAIQCPGGGRIARETVYQLGGYPQARSLKGFTRPVNRVQQELVEEGFLPEDAEELLRPEYDPGVKSYQRARAFIVAPEVVRMMLDHNQGKADWAS